jgi:hypothetical protein
MRRNTVVASRRRSWVPSLGLAVVVVVAVMAIVSSAALQLQALDLRHGHDALRAELQDVNRRLDASRYIWPIG